MNTVEQLKKEKQKLTKQIKDIQNQLGTALKDQATQQQIDKLSKQVEQFITNFSKKLVNFEKKKDIHQKTTTKQKIHNRIEENQKQAITKAENNFGNTFDTLSKKLKQLESKVAENSDVKKAVDEIATKLNSFNATFTNQVEVLKNYYSQQKAIALYQTESNAESQLDTSSEKKVDVKDALKLACDHISHISDMHNFTSDFTYCQDDYLSGLSNNDVHNENV